MHSSYKRLVKITLCLLGFQSYFGSSAETVDTCWKRATLSGYAERQMPYYVCIDDLDVRNPFQPDAKIALNASPVGGVFILKKRMENNEGWVMEARLLSTEFKPGSLCHERIECHMNIVLLINNQGYLRQEPMVEGSVIRQSECGPSEFILPVAFTPLNKSDPRPYPRH